MAEGRELSANGTVDWLAEYGSRNNWATGTAREAQDAANRGQFAVAVRANPGGIGHVAVVRPGKCDPETGATIAQAGWVNRNSSTVSEGFGDDAQITYYFHL